MPIAVGRTIPLFQGRAIASTTVTTAGTFYPIPLGAESHNVGGGHSTTTNPERWVASYPCTVALTGQVLFQANQAYTSTAPTYRWAFFFKNGVQLAAGGCDAYNGLLLTVNTFPGFLVDVVAGDYIDLRATSGTAGTTVYGDSGLGSVVKIEQVVR